MATHKGKIKLRTGESYRQKEDRYMYRWTDQNRQRHTIYASTIGELREKEQAIQKDILNGIISTNLTVAELYDKWRLFKSNLRPSSLSTYDIVYKNHLQPLYGSKKITDVKKSDIRQMCIDLLNEGYSCSYVQRLTTILGQMFEIAVDDNLLVKNPAERAMKGLLQHTSKKEGLTREEQDVLFRFAATQCKNRDTYLLMLILVNTGLRIGELCALTWDDVDFESRTLRVSKTMIRDRSVNPSVLHLGAPKPRAGYRVVPLTTIAVYALQELRSFVAEHNRDVGLSIDGVTNFCYLNKDGTPGRPDTLAMRITEMANRCNRFLQAQSEYDGFQIKHMAAHTLRHTFATRMHEAGADPKATQSILGHASIIMTMDVYTDISQETIRKAIELID